MPLGTAHRPLTTVCLTPAHRHNLTVSGEGPEAYRSTFVLALRRIAAEASERDADAPELLACAPLGAGGAVVLYREQPAGPVLGKRYDVQTFAALFSPALAADDLAEIAYRNELADPSGSGEVLDVGWADGLGYDRSQVQWVGAGEWLEA